MRKKSILNKAEKFIEYVFKEGIKSDTQRVQASRVRELIKNYLQPEEIRLRIIEMRWQYAFEALYRDFETFQ